MSNKPRYQKIKSYILDGIKQQVYRPSSKITTEIQLAEQFKVSRMTTKGVRAL